MSRKTVTLRRFDLKPALVVNGRTLSKDQADRFRQFSLEVSDAEAMRAGAEARRETARAPDTFAELRLAKRIEQGGVRGLRTLAEELAAEGFADQADADLTETIATRRDLGDVVERERDEGGATIVRVTTSSGAALAHSKGKFDGLEVRADRLLEIATLYRSCFEATSGMLTPAKNEVRGSGGDGAAEALVEAGRILAILRARQSPRHIVVLDYVCGMDLTIHRAASKLLCDHRVVEAHLREALVVATHNWGV